jgi:hypothetical protein
MHVQGTPNELVDDFGSQEDEILKVLTTSLPLTCDREGKQVYLACSEKHKLEVLIKLQENGDEIDLEELLRRICYLNYLLSWNA